MAAERLAEGAWLEGAAVFAFDALERELAAHGAPAELVQRARSARRDEQRHHAAMSGLATRFGARVPPVEIERIGVRTLLEVALENAVEGCVRETWGAAVAAFQGEQAEDRAVRRAMQSIAIDEAAHAALGWAVDRWARGKLGRSASARLDSARVQAVDQLVGQACHPVSDELTGALGLPGPAASRRLSAALAPLWS